MTKIINLNHGKTTIVDYDDYKYLSLFKWRFNTTGYATRTKKSISMSRIIMNAKKGEYVDHINGNKLDNRKCNLRIVTNQQNSWNKRLKCNGKNKFKGVRKRENKWQAYSTNNKIQINIGRFKTEIEAARAYDKWIIENRGIFGVTNKLLGNYKNIQRKE